MTLESLARTVAKARYGTEEHWAAFLPSATAVREDLINEATRTGNQTAVTAIRLLIRSA